MSLGFLPEIGSYKMIVISHGVSTFCTAALGHVLKLLIPSHLPSTIGSHAVSNGTEWGAESLKERSFGPLLSGFRWAAIQVLLQVQLRLSGLGV